MFVKLCWRVGLASVAIAVVLAIAGQASADFHWIAGLEPGNGDVLKIKYNNYENLLSSPAVGQNLYGVGFVSTIVNASNGDEVVWAHHSTDNGELTCVFNNYKVWHVVDPGSAGSPDGEIFFENGNMSIYWDDITTGTTKGIAYHGTNANPDPGGTFSDGQLWVGLTGTAGVVSAEPGGVAAKTTLHTEMDSFVGWSEGDSDGLFDVDLSNPGTVTSEFDSDHGWLFSTTADMKLRSTITDETDTYPQPGDPGYDSENWQYPVRSHDPVSSQHVPEPGSVVMLVGLGFCMAIAGWRRYRRRSPR